jgi:RNA polymerase sigma factor (sigma-70 family)
VASEHLELAEIEVLYRRHKAAVFYRCMRLLAGDEDAAMDAMHQTFVRAIKFRASCRKESDPIRWLFAIAFRVCMDLLKQRRRTIALADLEIPLDAEPDRSKLPIDVRLDQQRTVARLLPRFEPKVQEVVVMRFFDDLGVKEIAQRTGSSERTVARRLSDFLERARKLLEEKQS